MITKKGAMFGLDARIALAIFGALSVISGAALYSAIQEANTTAIITEINEVGKAYDSYVLDTGSEITLLNGSYLRIEKLISDTVKGWSGPYLSYEGTGSSHTLEHPKYSSIYIAHFKDLPWGHETSSDFTSPDSPTNATNLCVSGEVCYLWSGINGVELDLAKAVSLKIDGNDDVNSGNVRFFSRHLYIKFRPYDK
jgi:hypothetical protein